jgi:hypothetical protein
MSWFKGHFKTKPFIALVEIIIAQLNICRTVLGFLNIRQSKYIFFKKMLND